MVRIIANPEILGGKPVVADADIAFSSNSVPAFVGVNVVSAREGGWQLYEDKDICLNSVDKSIAVRIQLSWDREKSETEMQGRERRINHTQSFKTEQIEEFLKYQFDRFSNEESLYKKWYKTKLDWNLFVNWINKTVTKKWGVSTAVRAYHIAKTGFDIKINGAYQIPKFKDVKLGGRPLQLEKFNIVGNHWEYKDGVLIVHEDAGLQVRLFP